MKPQPAVNGRRSQRRRTRLPYHLGTDQRLQNPPPRNDQVVESSPRRIDMTTEAAPASATSGSVQLLNAGRSNGVMRASITPRPAPIPRTSHRGADGHAPRQTTAASAPSAAAAPGISLSSGSDDSTQRGPIGYG